MKIHNIINESEIASEHVKGGLDSYYQLTKAKALAKADGHDYDKLPEYHRGKDQPHKEKYMALAKEVNESNGTPLKDIFPNLDTNKDKYKGHLLQAIGSHVRNNFPDGRRGEWRKLLTDLLTMRSSEGFGRIYPHHFTMLDKAVDSLEAEIKRRPEIEKQKAEYRAEREKKHRERIKAEIKRRRREGEMTEELNDLRRTAGLEVKEVSEDSNEFENDLAMEFVELPLASMSKEEIEDQMSEIFKTIYHMGMEDEPETDAGNAMEELAHAVDDNGGYHNDDWRYPLEAEEISDEDVQAIIRHQQTVKDIIGHATEESAPVEFDNDSNEAMSDMRRMSGHEELNDLRKRAGLEVKERYKDQGIADTVKDQRGKEFQFDKSTKKFKSLDGEEAAVNTKLGKDLLRLRRNQMKKSTPSYNR